MVNYKIVYHKEVVKKDIPNLKAAKLDRKAKDLLDLLKIDPFYRPPSYEKLVGDLEGAYSRRINIQHKLVYQILEDIKTIKIISMWSHYEF